MASATRPKKDDLSEESTTPPTPPSPETMLIARPLKPRRLSFSGSTASGISCPSDDWATPNAAGFDDSLEVEMKMHGPPGIVDIAIGGTPKGAPPSGPAPLMPGQAAGPPPPYSPNLVEKMPQTPPHQWPHSAGYAHRAPLLSSGPPTPSGAMPAVADASQRLVWPADDREDTLVAQALTFLAMLLSGPNVPNLPPCGCYGGMLISSAISEGLGAQAAEAAKAAADGHGDKPVKVLLPWYPDHPGLVAFDHTKPAKLAEPQETQVEEPEVAKQLAQMLHQPHLVQPPLVLPPPGCAPPVMQPMPAVVPR
ncbi:unnamed protein product [Effrenium voratum]|uniref:Uncharacterized protein n=1 Tax=Effrenium voratum TaxID=2562239 RepID=A0AA36I4X6_9DINO|nr:unnamed protein product [Effrenium voratum]CAJ1381148.1 unnamed protein product [Effrenium voratum]CAJ1426596.1 unnamed protein product [Effrenium voratum]